MAQSVIEHKALNSFFAYCKPVELYNIITIRQEAQARLLPRNVCYTAASARLKERRLRQSPSNRYLSVRVRLAAGSLTAPTGNPASEQTLSLVAALCIGTSTKQGLQPLSAVIVHAAQVPLSHAEASLPVPDGYELNDLSLLLLSNDEHPDLRALGKASGSKLTAAISSSRAFGLLDKDSTVCWIRLHLDQLAPYQAVMERSALRISGASDTGSSSSMQADSRGTSGSSATGNIMKLEAGSRSGIKLYVTMAETVPVNKSAWPATADRHAPDQGSAAANGGSRDHSGGSTAREQGPLLGKRKADEHDHLEQADGVVHFRYLFDGGMQYYTEKTTRNSCPLCSLSCRSISGLQQHMTTSHSLFNFEFSPQRPDVLPVVNVSCPEEVQGNSFSFDNHHEDCNAVNKVHSFFCHPGLRRFRQKQYSMPERKRRKLPWYVATGPLAQWRQAGTSQQPVRQEVQSADTSLRVDKIALPVERQRARESVGAWGCVRKARRPTSSLPKRKPSERQRYFRARSHMPMLKEEVEGILNAPCTYPDSDDEEDVDEWKERCRRKLRMQTQLSTNEREFMFNWNLFLFKGPITADLQLPDACLKFAQGNAEHLANHAEIRQCFSCHLMTLWEFGVISASVVDQCLLALQARQALQKPQCARTKG